MRGNEYSMDLDKIRARYRQAGKGLKSKILDEFCANSGCHRKHGIRLLNGCFRRGRRLQKRGPKPLYDQDVLAVLKEIWLASNQMCSKKLKAAMALWLPHYPSELSNDAKARLLALSPATIDRLLKPCRLNYRRKHQCGTRPGTLLKTQIPIKTDHFDVKHPGFIEADTVAHCGGSMSGDFIWSISFTDIYSTWTENRAIWNKGADGVIEQIKALEITLPFEILGFDCDNGSEFLNHHLWRYFANRKKPVDFTRSRPYHKNDNAHVEQKNWTHVRQLLGYQRLDNPRLLPLINDLYQNEWSLFNNFFNPTMKLISKIKVNSKYIKRYDAPQTPYQRLLLSEHISPEKKQQLTALYQTLNPFVLKRSIALKLRNILKHTSPKGH